MEASTLPTSGTYDGISIYQASNLSGLGGLVGDAIASVEAALSLIGLGRLLPSLVAINNPVSVGQPVTFGPGTISGNGVTISDTQVVASGSSGFVVRSNGTEYVVVNGTLSGGVTVDGALQALEQTLTALPLGGLAAGAVKVLQKVIDNPLVDLGGLTLLPGSFLDGNPYSPPCFARGTRIATPEGETSVEMLEAGHVVRLARGGTATVKWVGRRRVDFALRPFSEGLQPVRITAGALDGQLPVRDLVVSPDHALFFDGVLVPAGLLVNGTTITREAVEQVEYFHVELDAHDVILAEGAAAESYLDTGNRSTFSNAALVSLAPTLEANAHAAACAPMVVEGEALAGIRAKLADIAAQRPEPLRLAS